MTLAARMRLQYDDKFHHYVATRPVIAEMHFFFFFGAVLGHQGCSSAAIAKVALRVV